MSKSLLFDLDGTLIDSAESIFSSFAAALARHGRQPAVPLDRTLIGPPLRETMRKISGCQDKDEIESLVEAFKNDYDDNGYLKTIAYPGITPGLTQLHTTGIPLFIVTNKRILPTTRILEYLEWTKLFKGVFALDSSTPPASNKSRLVAKIIAKEGIETSHSILIGDTPEDAEAARENGLNFAAALWGYGRFDETRLARAHRLEFPGDIASLG